MDTVNGSELRPQLHLTTGCLLTILMYFQEECNQESGTYKFAFASLIILNALMDIYICIKISVVLYWALLTEET